MPQFTTADIGTDLLPVQFSDIKSPAGTSAKYKCILPETEHSVKQLVTKHIFRRLIQLAYPAFVDLALVNLAIMLTFRDNQQALSSLWASKFFAITKASLICVLMMFFCSRQYFVI